MLILIIQVLLSALYVQTGNLMLIIATLIIPLLTDIPMIKIYSVVIFVTTIIIKRRQY